MEVSPRFHENQFTSYSLPSKEVKTLNESEIIHLHGRRAPI